MLRALLTLLLFASLASAEDATTAERVRKVERNADSKPIADEKRLLPKLKTPFEGAGAADDDFIAQLPKSRESDTSTVVPAAGRLGSGDHTRTLIWPRSPSGYGAA